MIRLGRIGRCAVPLGLGLALRLLTLTPGLPYIGYVDEGHSLRNVATLLRNGTWDPGWYGYPPLTFYLIAVPARALALGGRSHVDDLPTEEDRQSSKGPLYDVIGPVGLVVLGRLVMLALSVGTIVLTGLLARELFGEPAGLVAALLAAACPSFVIRGCYTMVDTSTVFFTVSTFLLCARLRADTSRLTLLAGGVGLTTALAIASKYSAAVLLPPVLMATLVASRRVKTLAAYAAGLVAGLFIAAPTLFLRTAEIARGLADQMRFYRIAPSGPSYLQAAIQPYELGVPLLVCAVVAIVWMLKVPAHRPMAAAWLLFAALLLAPLLRYRFQPFRNVLPLVPLACAATAGLLLSAFRSGRKSQRALAVTAAVAVGVSFAMGVVRFRESIIPTDSRVEAVNWLTRHAAAGDEIEILEDLAILPAERRRLAATARTRTCATLAPALSGSRFVVVGAGPFGCGERFVGWKTVASFGVVPTPGSPDLWRTNGEAIRILGAPVAPTEPR